MSYNGWKNYETWNVALWIGNDEGLYNMAVEEVENWKKYEYKRKPWEHTPGLYETFADHLREIGSLETPDHVAWNDSGLDLDALDEMMDELVDKE